ncbi:MAG: M20/M25/M40 family metallo-hydrolase, partial [Spirochaetota bacterium]|nr:M20/M25/M40 family metallo-hydrolase [Spirochaetota bacterium]
MNRDASLFAEAEKLLGDLIAFPSLSRHENTEIIEYVEAYLKRYGVHTTRIPIAEKRWNLFATIGPRRDGGLCLSGHLDVVPADKQGWNHLPFTLTRKSDRYYGRGTTDMKGFLALVLALVPVWTAGGTKSGGTAGKSSDAAGSSAPAAPFAPAAQHSTAVQPIHIALTYDEEDGCSGAPALIQELGASLPKPEAVIVGEPTGIVPVLGHRAGTACFTEVRGLSSHSSNPEAGINAIYTAADLI